MGFLAPSLLLGLLAAALPALAHLIGRRRATPVRFAAMQLLLRADRQVSARRRLREILLLVTRTAVAAALPLVFAKPFAEARSDVPASASRPQSAVLLLDDSASLRRRAGGRTLCDAVRDRARDLVAHFAPESDAALVLAAEGAAAPVGDLTTDRTRLRAAIDGFRCTARPADFGGALRRAAQLLGPADRRERRVYLITDLQAAGWEGAGAAEAGGPDVVLIDVARGAPWHNRAVLSLDAQAAPEVGPGAVALTAEIANFGAEAVPALPVTLLVDGEPVARGTVDVPAGGRVHKRFLHTLPAGDGRAHAAEVTLPADDFPLDDRRAALLERGRGLKTLLVDGDARTVRNEDEVFFLDAALHAGGAGFGVSTVLPDDLAGPALADVAVVFMANVSQPSREAAEALVRFVEAGGGLFISVGARVDADAWNQRLGRILPQPLGLRRTAAAMPGRTADGETVDTRPAERLAPIDRRHPLLASFPSGGEGLASARFFQYMLLQPVPETPDRAVILSYDNGAPALVERSVGRGRVMLLSTTVDREWTDLPIRPGFLPLVQEAARRLGGAPAHDAALASLVGQPREIPVAADDARIEITTPAGAVAVFRGETLPKPGHPVVFRDTGEPGFYRVRAAGRAGTLVERADDSFVVGFDARESDPATLPPDRRPDRAAAAAAGGAAPKRRVELWHALAAALIAFVLLESALTVRFRRSAAPRAT